MGYKPLPESEYPSLADKVSYEIFGEIVEICPFCGVKFCRKPMEKHLMTCEISIVFNDHILMEVQNHPARRFIAQTIQQHSARYLFHTYGAFKEADEREQDNEESKAFEAWEKGREDREEEGL